MIPDDEPLRVAVVGAGDMGSNHARVLDGLKGVELVAIVDPLEERARAVAERHGARWSTSVADIIDDVRAVTVAAPSSRHADVAVPLLERGIHCLVEKPMATTEADCTAIIEAARSSGAQVLVGHIERFNPAVIQLKEILHGEHDTFALDARRMSAVSSRITDVDVVLDLMIHDLDIVLDLVGRPVADVCARGATRADSLGQDYVTTLLTFDDGTLASLTASRVTQNQIRSLQVTTNQRFFTVDYIAQELLVYRQGRIDSLDEESPNHGRYVLDVGTERVFVRRVEPLAVELRHFVDVARGAEEPIVTGDQALATLRVVWAIQDDVRRRRTGG